MLHPQIVVHERDGRLAEQLRPLAVAERWAMRESRQVDPLWRTLRDGGPTIFVLKMREPDRDLELVGRVGWQLPEVATVVVGDLETAAGLAALSWDVGAAYALFPPLSRDLLPEIVAGLMRRAIRETLPAESST